MSIPKDFWFLLFFADLILLGCVALYAYYTYYKRLSELKKLQSDSHKKAEQILEEAKLISREILERVEQKADEILTHSQLFKSDLNKDFKNSLKELSDRYLVMIQDHSKKFTLDYETILMSVKNQSLIRSKQALENIENEVKTQLDESKVSLKTEMTKSLTKAVEEIDSYRRRELERVDKDIDQIVIQMAKDLLRINLPAKDHRKLVIQSLEKAKEQGMFFL